MYLSLAPLPLRTLICYPSPPEVDTSVLLLAHPIQGFTSAKADHSFNIYIIKGDIGGFTESEAGGIDEGEEHLVFVSRGIINEFDDILTRKCRR